jgi:putative GTP pyrophosphokinase
MKSTKELQNFLEEYEKYIDTVLKPAHEEIRTQFGQWLDPIYWSSIIKGKGSYPLPIRALYTRIKRPERVVDKILHKSDEYPKGLSPESFFKMHDTIGVRVIVFFLSQLPYIDRELRTSKSIEISEKLVPEAYWNEDQLKLYGLSHLERKEKESGYSSIHYVLRLTNSSIPLEALPWFELQVRTLAQELWCEMEHILAYKSEKRTNFSAKRRFQILNREISAVDEHFNLLYEELVQNQEKVKYHDKDLLSAENLPSVFNEINIKCAQQDFNSILALLQSRSVNTVGDLLKLASPKRLETINNTYISKIGRPPDSFELIASLGALQRVKDRKNEAAFVTSQIEYSKSWNKIRKDFMTNNDTNSKPSKP